jgi:antibiotic biosynthesis monooxygenase (ABM) superfamily enzyme
LLPATKSSHRPGYNEKSNATITPTTLQQLNSFFPIDSKPIPAGLGGFRKHLLAIYAFFAIIFKLALGFSLAGWMNPLAAAVIILMSTLVSIALVIAFLLLHAIVQNLIENRLE